jgi:hypothetical protein
MPGGNGHDKKRFRWKRYRDLQLNGTQSYLVKGLIPRQGLVLVWGPAKCGKSFWTFDLAMHVALGREYRGHRVQRGSVFYIALEGAHGYNARAEAWRQQCQGDSDAEPSLFLCGDTLNLARDKHILISELRSDFESEPPSVIVIDTVNRSLGGPEDDKTLGPYVQAADELREAFKCAVLLIHHSGYDKTHARGHTLLPAAVDAEIAVARDEQNHVTATVTSMRDGPADEVIASRLVQIAVGIDQDKDEITSCYIEPVVGAPRQAAKPARPARPLSDRNKRALNILINGIAETGQAPPASLGLPSSVNAVEAVDRWRKALFDADVLDRKKANPRTDFSRIKDALVVRNFIAIDRQDEFVWLMPKGGTDGSTP